jgi:histidinol dehydrogenase
MNVPPPIDARRRLPPAWTAFVRAPPLDDEAEAAARRILDDVRRRGDAAIVAWLRRLDGVATAPSRFRVPPEAFAGARARVDAAFRRAARETFRRVTRFARAGLRADWRVPTPGGGFLGERYVPLRRVGVYVPGGVAPLASTALMTVPLAAAAGVPEIAVCTPAGRDGRVNPHVLFALEVAGAREVYAIGGVPAIGAMAFGTRAVPRVDKIVGPGNRFVTAAKRQVFGRAAIEMVAGPSEIAILADDSPTPAQAAADLLSQAEHGTGHERALLVTTSMPLARAVRRELLRAADAPDASDALRRVLRSRTRLVVAPDLETGARLIDEFAPEHLELLARRPERLLPLIRCAGAVFLGPWTPESAGDFAAGPSHVLPTGGTARFFSGLTAEDFRRRTSVLRLSRRDLLDLLPVIEAFSRVEGLPAHARSARERLRRP